MSKPFAIHEDLERNNIGVYGDAGRLWLKDLPNLVEEFEQKWSITVGPPFPNLSFNFAAPATRLNGVRVVLKACFPSDDFGSEAEALRLYRRNGAVELINSDKERGVLLIEYATPGTLLSELEDDDEATQIAANIMRKIRRPAPKQHKFPTIGDWGKGFGKMRSHFNGGSGPFPPRLLDRAERLFAELEASQSEPVVLHGDLHHFNILAATREPWLAIDPQGVVGEPEYEVGALLRNPMPELGTRTGLREISERRINILTDELGYDRERLIGWGLSQAVLSAWWSIEDNSGAWDVAIAVAEALSKL